MMALAAMMLLSFPVACRARCHPRAAKPQPCGCGPPSTSSWSPAMYVMDTKTEPDGLGEPGSFQ